MALNEFRRSRDLVAVRGEGHGFARFEPEDTQTGVIPAGTIGIDVEAVAAVAGRSFG